MPRANWHWQAVLRDPHSHHFMVVQIERCSEKEARRLAERQNDLFAQNYDRQHYVLDSLEKVKNGS